VFLRPVLEHTSGIFNKLIKEPGHSIVPANRIPAVANPNHLVALMFPAAAVLQLNLLAIANNLEVFQSVERWQYAGLSTLYKSVDEPVAELDGEWAAQV
jgi:hypothetical protein